MIKGFGSSNVDFECPFCGHKTGIKLQEALQSKKSFRCSHCGKTVTVEKDPSVGRTMKEADKSLKQLEKSLKDLEKAFKKR